MEDLVKILENGECPTCGEELLLVKIAGEKDFVDKFHYEMPVIPTSIWEKGVTEKGELTFKCKNGHLHSVFMTFGGDWTVN